MTINDSDINNIFISFSFVAPAIELIAPAI